MSLRVWDDGPHFKSDERSRHDEKADKRAAKEKNWREVCRQVDKRDNYRCRACGVSTDTDAIDPLGRGHRHHLTFRSKGGQDVASNLATLCARCHDAIHRKRTLRIEHGPFGADGPLEIWRTNEQGEYLSRREVGIHRVEHD